MADSEQLHLEDLSLYRPRSVDCFEKLEQIGDGVYGKVYMAKERRTGEIVALKRIRMDSQRERVPIEIVLEIKLLQKLNHHPNVIQLKEIVTSSPGPGKDQQEQGSQVDWRNYKGDIYMVLEYMDHDLAGLLARPGICFSVPQIKCYMRQLLTGLHYCHVNKLLHGDIKGSNILIDNEGNLKLADFSLWRSFPDDPRKIITNNVITLRYRPPELLYGSTEYGPEVDMWAVGCVFAELLNGKPIFRGNFELEHLNRIYSVCGSPDEENWPAVTSLPTYQRCKPPFTVPRRLRQIFQHFDPLALDLLDRMLALNPQARISARHALESEYFSTEPLPCDPKSLPRYEPSHKFRMRKKRRTNQHTVQRGPNEALVHHGPINNV